MPFTGSAFTKTYLLMPPSSPIGIAIHKPPERGLVPPVAHVVEPKLVVKLERQRNPTFVTVEPLGGPW